MQHLEVSGLVRPIKGSLGIKGLSFWDVMAHHLIIPTFQSSVPVFIFMVTVFSVMLPFLSYFLYCLHCQGTEVF
jgi:hypothetical protein